MGSLLGRIADWPDRRWIVVGCGLSVVVAVAIGFAVYGLLGQGGVGGASFAGILGAGLTLWATLTLYLQLRQRRSSREIRSLINVRPLTGKLPLDLGGWAVDPTLADEVVRTLCRRRPELVVECGSGWTTVLMAACLEELEKGRVVALEHEERFARKTRELLKAAGSSDHGKVRLAPLTEQDVNGAERLWYDASVVRSIAGPIDLLLVDGPPGRLGPEIRYPAVPALRDRLAKECVVFLDDGYRDGEARIARAWGRELGVEPVLEAWGKGFWVLDRAEAGPNGPRGEALRS